MNFLTQAGLTLASGAVAWIVICALFYVFRPRPKPPPVLFHQGDAIGVHLILTLPRAATREDVNDWLGRTVAGCGSMSEDNPLCNCEPEARIMQWGPAVVEGLP